MTYFPLHQTTCFFIPLVAPCKPLLSYNEAIKSAKLEELYRRAYKILYDNRDFLLAVQKELLEHETLLNSDLAKIRESCT